MLKKQLHDPEEVLPKLKERKRRKKKQHDRTATELPPLRDGEVVKVKKGEQVIACQSVTQILPSPKSNMVDGGEIVGTC